MITYEHQSFVGVPQNTTEDIHALGFAKEEVIRINDCNIDANGITEGLKFSKSWEVVVNNTHIIGGTEDCVDICRGGQMYFNGCVFEQNIGDQCFTIKGSARDILFENCTFKGSPKAAFVDLGNYSNYDQVKRPKTRRISFVNCTFEIKWWKFWIAGVRVLYAEKPSFKNCKGDSCIVIPQWFTAIFFWCRNQGWFGGKVVVDPSELIVEPREEI